VVLVIRNTKSPIYIHAIVSSNNTGELTAIYEALLDIEKHRTLEDINCIVYDSEYTVKITLGLQTPKK
jgi:ribonuclease HI